jgi:hypothetical protein
MFALLASSAADGGDLHLGEQLPMALRPLVMLAAPEFDDGDLVTAALGHDLALDLAAADERCTYFDIGAGAYHEHLVELDRVPDGGIEPLYPEAVAFGCSILFTARFENSVHVGDSWTNVVA